MTDITLTLVRSDQPANVLDLSCLRQPETDGRLRAAVSVRGPLYGQRHGWRSERERSLENGLGADIADESRLTGAAGVASPTGAKNTGLARVLDRLGADSSRKLVERVPTIRSMGPAAFNLGNLVQSMPCGELVHVLQGSSRGRLGEPK